MFSRFSSFLSTQFFSEKKRNTKRLQIWLLFEKRHGAGGGIRISSSNKEIWKRKCYQNSFLCWKQILWYCSMTNEWCVSLCCRFCLGVCTNVDMDWTLLLKLCVYIVPLKEIAVISVQIDLLTILVKSFTLHLLYTEIADDKCCYIKIPSASM